MCNSDLGLVVLLECLFIDENVSCVQAETRAEFAERSVAKLEKTIDDLEGTSSVCCL